MGSLFPISPTPPVQRFARSKFGPPAFFIFMAVMVWGAFSQFRHTFSSSVLRSSDFDFIVITNMVLWNFVTRGLSFWKRWVAPLSGCVVCWWLADEAARHMQLALTSDQVLPATLYFAAFFGACLLFLVLIPIEPQLYRAGIVPREQLWFWPVSYGITGLAIMGYAGVIFVHHLKSLSLRPNELDFIAARNLVVYLSIALNLLAFARFVLPWAGRKAPQIEGNG